MSIDRLAKEGNQFILHTNGVICEDIEEIASSNLFEDFVRRFVHYLQEKDSTLLEEFNSDLSDPAEVSKLTGLLRALAKTPLDQAIAEVPDTSDYASQQHPLQMFIEQLYNFWRSFDRYMVCHCEPNKVCQGQAFYLQFNNTMEKLSALVRSLYRSICENITGEHPRIYRQVSAGCEVGHIAVEREWKCPEEYRKQLEGIPFIRQTLLTPPLLISPPMNKRTGQFRRVGENPLNGLEIEKSKWLCYPAQVGQLVIFVYFHQKFMGLGSSLANLFELATEEQIEAGPDAVFLYGAPAEPMSLFGKLPTVFYDDVENNLLVGAIPNEDRFGYFGYIKKMVLTLHNVAMMKKGRMPFHGAMVHIVLKDGAAASVLLIGDTAAGKSESLEAFRKLGKDTIRDLRIVADDMGSLDLSEYGRVLGYGTEIGAFVRLDDLESGFAFGQIDRAIIMNPHQVNARVVIPVTYLEEILRGYPVDIMLYANNYDQVDENHPLIEVFPSVEIALRVFREGAAMAKGTTTSTGLTHSYFANIFGPPQYRELHERLAIRTFEAAFNTGVYVGQIRTRLGISGFETTGPEEAAQALFSLIRERSSAIA